MVIPGLIAVLAPVATGYLLGVSGLGGLLAGALVTGVLMALMMANAGGVWDNAKKYIEEGHHGGKGSEPHKAAVIGDTVGDPFKDTSGPSLNILIKLMTIVAVIFAPLVVAGWDDARKPIDWRLGCEYDAPLRRYRRSRQFRRRRPGGRFWAPVDRRGEGGDALTGGMALL